MGTAPKTLRPYQARLVSDVGRASGDVLVEQPTGSGKTVQIVTLVAMHLGKRFTHAVIAAPQEQIEQGFVQRDYRAVGFPACPGGAAPNIQTPEHLITGARESRLGSVNRLLLYLRQSGPTDHAFACTHAALNRIRPDQLPADLTGKALFIDEAHHASADGLAEIVALWRERGGQLFFFTATPYRGDGRRVVLDDMRTFRRSLAEHMAEGFAPRHLESEVVALGRRGDTVTAGQFNGTDAPPASYFEELVSGICRRWVEDGKPKAIVRVPPMRGGRSGTLVSRLTHALTALGARVLDATGTGAADKNRFLAGLEAEKNATFAESTVDVIIGIQRVLEGTDWPVCSAAYCVGMPGSLNTVVQFLGRAMRLKGDGHPAAHRDRARLVFFVPCAGGSALADLSLDHSRHALLTCCFLADHEVGQEWIVLREVRRGIEAALGRHDESPAAADAENAADEPIDPEVRAEVELALASASEQILSDGGEPTAGEVIRHAALKWPDLPEAALQRVAAEFLAAQTTPGGEAVRDAIRGEVARRLRIDPRVKEAMAAAFATVLEEFRGATLRDSTVLEAVGRQVHGVTGGQMREFAQRLRDAAPRPLTEEQILGWADQHHERTGGWPRIGSGQIDEVPGEVWANVDAALRGGLRGLPGGSSLPQLLSQQRDAPYHLGQDELSAEIILDWADAYKARVGQWPTIQSGAVHECPGKTWLNVHAALYHGLLGLPGQSSLARLLADHRGVSNSAARPALTTDLILAWADSYRARTTSWPRQNSGLIPESDGDTWAGVQLALVRGNRGLPGGSSLAQLLAEHRGARNAGRLPALTVPQVLAWADKHRQRTGSWPQVLSGPITDASGETWSGVEQALRKGTRGLAGGSSLAQLLAERHSARNPRDLPKLSLELILSWADAYHQRTQQWPTANSGPIEEGHSETWRNVDTALSRGYRGLPGKASLASVLLEHRSVRNRNKPPKLSEAGILAWVASHYRTTGAWPTAGSGPIPDATGEDWVNVNQALRLGLRGLPGGSSLSRLIKEHRAATAPCSVAPSTTAPTDQPR